MTLALDRATAALGNQNVKAFLHVIGAGESNERLDEEAYRTISKQAGGGFLKEWKHPYYGITTTALGHSTACGAPQFLGTTWARCDEQLGLGGDFSPPNQNVAAVHLIIGRGALQAVEAGDVGRALTLLRDEWDSFKRMPLTRAESIFVGYGGTLAGAPAATQPAAPIEERPLPKPEVSMGALLAFAPLLSQLIPQIAALFKPESEVAKRNVGLAEVLVKTITDAAGAANLGDAVQKMQESPEVQKTVQQAVVTQPQIMESLRVVEIGEGGIGGARAANLAAATAPETKWYTQIASPVFIMSIALCAMLIMVLGNVLGMPWGGSFQEWSENTRSNVVFAIITGAIGAITGYWFGTTVASNKKDATIAAQAGVPPQTNA